MNYFLKNVLGTAQLSPTVCLPGLRSEGHSSVAGRAALQVEEEEKEDNSNMLS